jgi:hypothetical protein
MNIPLVLILTGVRTSIFGNAPDSLQDLKRSSGFVWHFEGENGSEKSP